MSKQYDEYLAAHRDNVKKAYEWLKDNLHTMIFCDISESNMDIIINNHDLSKYEPEEYIRYDNYFYGLNFYGLNIDHKKEEEKIKNEFNYAWLLHIHSNPHHWQHWVLINDNNNPKPVDMPSEYIIEMICDWWSFSWFRNDLYEIFNFYEANKKTMILSDNTRESVEGILEAIRTKLEEKEKK